LQNLQLTETQHGKVEERYKAIARIIDGPESPFIDIESNLYPQGSMRLGTTVKPIGGPHDLDFVCEFAVSHQHVNPMALLDEMYGLSIRQAKFPVVKTMDSFDLPGHTHPEQSPGAGTDAMRLPRSP
jgi:hypothetical protein